MPQEFRVIIEPKLPAKLRQEIDDAVRTAIMGKLAKLDLSSDISIGKLPKDIGGGHTLGMIVKI